MTDKPCTCHPDDNPPVPCPQKYALSECKAATRIAAAPERVLFVYLEDRWQEAKDWPRMYGAKYRWFVPGEEA